MRKEFRSKDFYVSAILLASRRIFLNRLEHEQSGIVTFVFDDPDNLAKDTIQDHWGRKHKTISLDLVEAIKQLKARIHSGI